VKLKAVALNNVLVDYLVKLGEKTEEILDRAIDKYEWLTQYLANSINTVLSKHGKAVPETVRAKLLPDQLQRAIIGINEYLKAKAVNEDKATIPVNELMNVMRDKGLVSGHPENARRLRKYLSRYMNVLEELGILYSEASDTIQVNTQVLNDRRRGAGHGVRKIISHLV